MLRALNRLAPRPGCQPSTVLVLPARGRKTRHDPPAKSKVGRVKMPPAVDPAEFFVLTERYRQYRQTVNALRCVERAGGHRPPPREYWGGRMGADLKLVPTQARVRVGSAQEGVRGPVRGPG